MAEKDDDESGEEEELLCSECGADLGLGDMLLTIKGKEFGLCSDCEGDCVSEVEDD